MKYQEVQEITNAFIKHVQGFGTELKSYRFVDFDNEREEKEQIGLQLNMHKEIVLGSETGIELGGMNSKSFSLVYPLKTHKGMNSSNIVHIVGPGVDELNSSKVDFSLFVLVAVNHLTDETYTDLRNLAFISDAIEGFTIRSIPRRFWCRISQGVMDKGFSFRFLGEAICSLYRKKFGSIIHSIEVLMISSNPNLIDKWLEYTEEMREDLNARWRAKVDTWKKRVGCDYEWACKMCPYFKSCQSLQEVLERRRNLEV